MEREEAARELIWRANSALVERLLSIWNDQDDPGLSEIDNKRRRYARILWAMGAYFHAIGHDKLPGLGIYIGNLGVALEDLIDGVTDPLFVTKGSKRQHAHLGCPASSGARLGMLNPKRPIPIARYGSKLRSKTLQGPGESEARRELGPKGLVAFVVR